MALTLIVENGTNIDGANTYASVETVREYSANRGVTLSVDDDAVAIQIVKAMDYLSTFEGRWKGQQTYVTQSLPWPRGGIYYSGYSYQPNTAIPAKLIAALGQLVIEQHNGIELFFATDTGEAWITREKLDVIETEYSEAVRLAQMARGGKGPTLPLVDALLAPLLTAGGFSLVTVRV